MDPNERKLKQVYENAYKRRRCKRVAKHAGDLVTMLLGEKPQRMTDERWKREFGEKIGEAMGASPWQTAKWRTQLRELSERYVKLSDRDEKLKNILRACRGGAAITPGGFSTKAWDNLLYWIDHNRH